MADYILVVDDEPDVRELFKITLSMAGYRIAVAEDGLKAIESIKQEVPQLIVLDLMMPRLDGFGVLEKLREDKPADSLKVLVATAKTIDDSDRDRLEAWPVVGLLNKGELDIAKMVVDVKGILDKKVTAPSAGGSSSEQTKPPAKPDMPSAETAKAPAKPDVPSSETAKPPARPDVAK